MTDPAIIDLLREIRDELRILNATQRPLRCSGADRGRLCRLLPGIVGSFGSEPFTVREVLQNPALSAVAGLNAHALGGLLARAADDEGDFDGFSVERCATEHGAMLWRVVSKLPESL